MGNVMKRILLAGAALLALTAAQPTLAADAPVYKGPAPVAFAPFSWNGCYIGVNIGAGWGTSDHGPTTPPASTGATASTSGWLAGGQIGCNWHVSPGFVLGIEGDYDWANIRGSGPHGGLGGINFESRLHHLGTVRGRIGYAMDRSLLYVTGGWAWGRHTSDAVGGGVVLATDTQTHSGWALGAGWEWAFAPNWSAKLEYLYIDLGSKTYTVPGFSAPIDVQLSTLKLGVNYRF